MDNRKYRLCLALLAGLLVFSASLVGAESPSPEQRDIAAFLGMFLVMVLVLAGGGVLFFLLVLVTSAPHLFRDLTCKQQLGEGPRRLLLVISVPFFLFFFLPGVVFWLIVKLVLWVMKGFKQDGPLETQPATSDGQSFTIVGQMQLKAKGGSEKPPLLVEDDPALPPVLPPK